MDTVIILQIRSWVSAVVAVLVAAVGTLEPLSVVEEEEPVLVVVVVQSGS